MVFPGIVTVFPGKLRSVWFKMKWPKYHIRHKNRQNFCVCIASLGNNVEPIDISGLEKNPHHDFFQYNYLTRCKNVKGNLQCWKNKLNINLGIADTGHIITICLLTSNREKFTNSV